LIRPLTLAALALVASSPAWAASTADVVETSPGADATLGRNESFYVRIAYKSDEPINLWARPYFHGEEVEKAMSNASAKYVGEGEALGWFALIEAGEVDEVRILAGGGKPYRQWELAREPVQLIWTTASASGVRPAPWVEELKAATDARMREEAQRRASEPVSVGETAFFGGFMLLMGALGLAGVIVPLWSVWKWRGGWRIAAAIPAGVVTFVVLRIVIDTARDPTSHNLWPFEVLMAGVGALLAIGVLKLLRRLMRVEAT
jgi:hypothetical protein